MNAVPISLPDPGFSSVWIIDDDRSIRWVFEKALAREGIAHRTFGTAQEALDHLDEELPQVVVSDIRMPGLSGLELMQRFKERLPSTPVIIMTAYSDLESAVAAFQGGAFEYLPKPFDVDHAVDLVRRAMEESRRQQVEAPPENAETPEILGQAPAMQEVFRAIGRLAHSHATVLITGESGTGKELVARALHRHSPRAGRAFIAINTAAIPKDLLESELFGHERGAFTGAVAQKKGKLEIADGGTVFLDEIGELAPTLQSKLLRALQLREFERVGGTRPVHVDIRVVSATNRNLAEDIAAGRFRSDLYHRLHVVEIHVPPLRERREDIPVLAAHFLQRSARTAARPVRGIAPDAMQYLTAYDWPGNVRELENTIERAVVLGSSDFVMRDDLPDALLEAPASGEVDRPRFHEAVREAKVRVIVDTFREARRNYTDTARLLGLHPNYLHRLIKNLDLKAALEEDR